MTIQTVDRVLLCALLARLKHDFKVYHCPNDEECPWEVVLKVDGHEVCFTFGPEDELVAICVC